MVVDFNSVFKEHFGLKAGFGHYLLSVIVIMCLLILIICIFVDYYIVFKAKVAFQVHLK